MMKGTVGAHVKAMYQVMKYCMSTAAHGLLLHPDGVWDGTREFLFWIKGKSNSKYAKDDSRKSINGWAIWLMLAPIVFRSKMMPIVALSVTEAELFAATQCAQDMLYTMRVLESMGLRVKKPMRLFVDNKGAVDLANNWRVGGRTRHIEVKQYFLRELKEARMIDTIWMKGNDMTSDMLTKNLGRQLFEKHIKHFCGEDEYMFGDIIFKPELSKGRVSQTRLLKRSLRVPNGNRG